MSKGNVYNTLFYLHTQTHTHTDTDTDGQTDKHTH